MNVKNAFGLILSLLMLFHVTRPVYVSSSRSLLIFYLAHVISACLDDCVSPQQHVVIVPGNFGLASILPAPSLLIAVACLYGCLPVAFGGFLSVFSEFVCLRHSVMTFLFASAFNYIRVVQAHLQSVNASIFFAIWSACSFAAMFMSPGIHFPLILQFVCCKLFTSSRHFYTYSLFPVRPPDMAFREFWLSTSRKTCFFSTPDSCRASCTSWIACVTRSSMSLLLPMLHHTWKSVFILIGDFSVHVLVLDMLPSSFLSGGCMPGLLNPGGF